ncbi:DUF6328 family protein [Nocardioides sp. CER19]|uniref:DUF6328 family protein n=1 Tax=Nocardioides sp. CER19 TaxID=3038538 RepID=UPI00244A8C1B|nr:DUF6328 family protein [Nocardioides sp. CER19]MDH2413634.1 DUF6328 family protein [Nocardioides sp. CER19]
MTLDDVPQSSGGNGRDETAAERMDRLWGDILQELRVMQTGAQLLSGFLLTLPFQSTFKDLDGFGKTLYLTLVALTVVTTALVMTAVATHQRLTGRHVKDRVVAMGRGVIRLVLLMLALILVGITVFVFDVVLDRAPAIIAGIVAAVVLATLLLVVPERLRRLG